jgi:hypothetical protein
VTDDTDLPCENQTLCSLLRLGPAHLANLVLDSRTMRPPNLAQSLALKRYRTVPSAELKTLLEKQSFFYMLGDTKPDHIASAQSLMQLEH